MEEEQEDQSPSNLVGGEDETESYNQEEEDETKLDNQEEEPGKDAATTNPTEGIENLGAPTTKVEAGAALDVTTIEDEVVGAMMTEGDVEVLTIESSLEWMGTLIEEETEMAETSEDAEIRYIPSTSAVELEAPLP